MVSKISITTLAFLHLLLPLLFLVSTPYAAENSSADGDVFLPSAVKEPLAAPAQKPDLEMDPLASKWEIVTQNVGVSAMHMQLMINNKVVWFDTTNLGPSALMQNPRWCRKDLKGLDDCWAHGVTYDPYTAKVVKTLGLTLNPWCSSGGLSSTGKLINTGGYDNGIRGIRIVDPCDTCDFRENIGLASNRWYASQQMLENGDIIVVASQQMLENGDIIVVGGRRSPNYEFIVPDQLKFPNKQFPLRLLVETTDGHLENNLYPFVYLLPDGNVFLFANDRSIIFNPRTGRTIRELPKLPGGSRNYPASGQSALLPLKLTPNTKANDFVKAEVLVCGGNTHEAFKVTERPPRQFPPALKDCGRIVANQVGAQWEIDEMPSRRVMGDMLILPNGDLLLLNGAQTGTAAWDAAEEPNFTPVLYSPNKPKGSRFTQLKLTRIARMYHSSSGVMPDGKILVAGSNTHATYDFRAKYPTDMRVQKFSPPYLAPALQKFRPEILDITPKQLVYGQNFKINIRLDVPADISGIKVTMYPPPFTTHGFSQGQRMLILGLTSVANKTISAVAPPSGKLAPPGYYLIFVVHRGVPSKGMWVHIK
ncbi:aldehyde oxidase GLOX1-like [Ipomoea triloba]|uniref:aldehyde oxidase GLOX1-like n=1 Tax=Ipomoea triloba TaxID=35885 RepID=UPI00125E3DB3|nr:aldehyde oxidase GLOX1-like [Ipomoea triloba]